MDGDCSRCSHDCCAARSAGSSHQDASEVGSGAGAASGAPHTQPAWPAPPRSEASCGTSVSDFAGPTGAADGAAGSAPEAVSPTSMECSSGGGEADCASPPRAGGGSQAAVIAGGAGDPAHSGPHGQDENPLEGHPRYRKIRDLNW